MLDGISNVSQIHQKYLDLDQSTSYLSSENSEGLALYFDDSKPSSSSQFNSYSNVKIKLNNKICMNLDEAEALIPDVKSNLQGVLIQIKSK